MLRVNIGEREGDERERKKVEAVEGQGKEADEGGWRETDKWRRELQFALVPSGMQSRSRGDASWIKAGIRPSKESH